MLGVVPKGRLFALTRDELVECLVLVRAMREGRLDRIEMPNGPLDIPAQQIAATSRATSGAKTISTPCAAVPIPTATCPARSTSKSSKWRARAWSHRGRREAYLHRDRVAGRLRARRGTRMTAITCGGAIPDTADYRVVTDDEDRTVVGTVDEDFAIERMAVTFSCWGTRRGDPPRARRRSGGERVRSAANDPLRRGEALGRTAELSSGSRPTPRRDRASPADSGARTSVPEANCCVSPQGASKRWTTSKQSGSNRFIAIATSPLRTILRRIGRHAIGSACPFGSADQPGVGLASCGRDFAARSISSCKPRRTQRNRALDGTAPELPARANVPATLDPAESRAGIPRAGVTRRCRIFSARRRWNVTRC